MRPFVLAPIAFAVVVAASSEARAWGLHTGDTIGTGDNMAYGEAGWPGITAGFAHGLNDKLEVGGKLDVLYGIEGTPHAFFGLGFGGTIRYTILRTDQYSLEAHVFPGFKFDAFSPVVFFGLSFPIGAEFGYHLTREATVSVGFDVPMFADFTNGGYFCAVPEGGPGFEYHLTEHVTFGAVTRFGGAVVAGNAATFSDFAFRTQAFFGYRM
ncbi:MAG TPA: hypothetical protein VHB21_08555 [Minicystis sp.]|nr:hypothetical protein [Minicystis sp.]